MKLPEVLPQLTGRWLLAYRVLWVGFMLLALAVFTNGNWRAYQAGLADNRAIYRVGLRGASTASNPWRVAPTTQEARAAGLRFGDTLLAVDGRRLPAQVSDRAAWRALDGPDGSRVDVRVRGTDGQERALVLTRSDAQLAQAEALAPLPIQARFILYGAVSSLATLSALLASAILFRRRVHDPVAAMLSLALVSVVPAAGLGGLGLPPAILEPLESAFGAITLACLGLGLALFPDGRLQPRWPLLVLPIALLWRGVGVFWPGSAVSRLLGVLFIVIVVASLWLRFRRAAAGPQRQQLKALMFGACVFCALGVCQWIEMYYVVLEQDLGSYFWWVLALNLTISLAILALCLSVLVALLRYRLYDADVVISRSAAYAGLTVAMVAIFAASEEMLELLAKQYFSQSAGAAAGVLAAAIAAALFVPLHARLTAWAERRFQRQLTELRTRLPLAVADLRESATLGQLAEEVLARVQAGVRASHLAFVSVEAGAPMLEAARGDAASASQVQEWLAQWQPRGNGEDAQVDRADGLFPLRLPLSTGGAAPVGWLLLGPRPDGSFFSSDELEVLREIEEPLARAVAIVRRNEAWKGALAERLAAMDAVLARLMRAVGSAQ